MSTTETTPTTTTTTPPPPAPRPARRSAPPAPCTPAGACAAPRGPVPPEIAAVDVPATVPGTVHTDLLAAGLIPDPYLDDNERLLAWIGQADWSLRDDLRLEARRARPHRAGLRGARHRRHRACSTARWSPRRATCTAPTASTVGSRLRAGRTSCGHVRLGRCATPTAPSLELGCRPARQPPPLQRDPQDGVQLRLGLGPRPGDLGHLAARDAGVVVAARLAAVRPVVTRRRRRGASSTCTSTSTAGPDAGPVTVTARPSATSRMPARVAPGAEHRPAGGRRRRRAVVAARARRAAALTWAR